VIGYDFGHQMALAQGLQRDSRDLSESLRAWYRKQQLRGEAWMKSWHGGSRADPAVLVAFLILLRYDALSAMVRRLRLGWQLRSAKTARTNPQLASRLYAELLRMLARRGLRREATQTPFEFAAAVDSPNLAPTVHEFTQLMLTRASAARPAIQRACASCSTRFARHWRRDFSYPTTVRRPFTIENCAKA